MKRLSLDLACVGCYLLIPAIIFFGVTILNDSVGIGLGIIFFGSLLSIALATVFQYVGKLMDNGFLEEQSNKPFTNLSGTPWEKDDNSNM